VGVFVDQALTARSWYHGSNIKAAEEYLGEMISNALNNSNQQTKLDEIRDKVEEMTIAHPLYEGWNYESPE